MQPTNPSSSNKGPEPTPPKLEQVDPMTKTSSRLFIGAVMLLIAIPIIFVSFIFFTAAKQADKSSNSNQSPKAAVPQEITECLVAKDFASTYPAYERYESFGNTSLASVFFEPDTTEYAFEATNESLDTMAKFTKENEENKFVLQISGSVNANTGSAADITLANARAEKVKSDLVSRGVQAERVVIEAPEQYDQSSSQTDLAKSANRHVTVWAKSTCEQ